MTPGTPESRLADRLAWLTLYSAAFGWLEAAVVIYLRAIFYPDGFDFPLILTDDRIALVELSRELATLLMLLGVAGLAARTAWGRFGAFAVSFGVWDLVFYLGLKLMLGWPGSLATWDLLFLVPGIWTGPVWSAAAIAALLVICGAWIMAADSAGRRPRPGWIDWSGAALSLALLLGAFMWNHSLVAAGGVPARFPWPVWLGGVIVGLAVFGRLFLRPEGETPPDRGGGPPGSGRP